MAIDHGSSNGNPRAVKDPLPTVMTKDRLALIQPFILQQQSGGAPRGVSDPLPSIAGKGAQALIQPFIITPGGCDMGVGRTVDEPMPTVLCHERFALVSPFMIPFFSERAGQDPRTHRIDEPLPAVTSHGAGALIEPFVVQVNHGKKSKADVNGRIRSVRRPIGTVTGENGHGLVQPLLVKYYKTGRAQPVTRPVPTVTGKDRFALVTPSLVKIPEGYELRAYFRMFDDVELARAMGFEGHEFKGTKKQRILMIGNAVEVNQAEALITAILA
jgi:DNA (cytosine-5)-methyltransferase 1